MKNVFSTSLGKVKSEQLFLVISLINFVVILVILLFHFVKSVILTKNCSRYIKSVICVELAPPICSQYKVKLVKQ